MKKIAVVGVIGIAVVGAYLLLQKTSGFHVDFGSLVSRTASSTSPSSLMAAISTTTQKTIQTSQKTLVSTGEHIIQSITGPIIHDVSSYVSDAVGNTAQNVIQGIHALTGTSDQNTQQTSPVTYVTHIGLSTSFQLSSTYLSDMQNNFSCVVQWGDGTQTQQQHILISDNTTFSHTWRAAGTYPITFTLTSGNNQHIYSVRIAVQ